MAFECIKKVKDIALINSAYNIGGKT